VSRPEIARIRGVASDSAAATLLERGLIEEHGRSQFGAVLYRTTPLFLKLFGLQSLEALPDVSQWDPTPEEQGALRERLLRAGDARAGVAAVTAGGADADEAHHKHHDEAELAAVTSIAPGDDDVPGDDAPEDDPAA